MMVLLAVDAQNDLARYSISLYAMQCNAMMIMGAGVSLYAHISLTNECA